MNNKQYGTAIDFGTSAVRAALLHADEPSAAVQVSVPNRLGDFGPDILSRIEACSDDARREAVFNAASGTLADVMEALSDASGVSSEKAALTVIAASTTQMYLLLRRDPFCIARPPYQIPLRDPGFLKAEDLLPSLTGTVYFVPCAANYLGGDVLSSLLCARQYRPDNSAGTSAIVPADQRNTPGASFPAGEALLRPGEALLDLGINAEFAACGKDSVIYCGSCAAGSALDTESGAFTASDLTEEIAALYKEGLVNKRGRLVKDGSPQITEVVREGSTRPMAAVRCASGLLLQSDIALFMQAKASVATMIDYILEKADLAYEDLYAVYLTGQLGCALDLAAAQETGLLPSLPEGQYVKVQDAALRGAETVLCNIRKSDSCAAKLSDFYLRYIQLKEVDDYLELMLPHLTFL